MLNVKRIVCLSFPIAILIILYIYSDIDVYKYLHLEAKQTLSKIILSTSNISIILVIKNTQDLEIFSVAYKTLLCYSRLKKYDFVLMDLSKDNVYAKNCEHNDFFFRRHCATVNYMKDHIGTKYVLFIDGDMGVINPMHYIEEYIEPGMDLIFYNRYYNFEVMAGSYIAKNSEYARNFLQYWADYNYKLPNSFHGTDNGAIHQVFMDKFAKQDRCQQLWNASKDWGGLWDWEACVRHELGGFDMDTYDNRVKIIKKGQQSWARDGWLTETKWSDRDFIFHGWKQSKQDQDQYDSWIYPFCDDEFDLSLCSDDNALKNWCYKNYLRKSDKEISALLDERDREVRKDYEKTLNRNFQKNLYLPENQNNTKQLVLKRFLKSLPKNGCTEQTKLLLAILSSPDEFEDREWIRKTWGNQSELEMTSKRIFMIGQSQNSSLNKQVIEEARKFRDILILNFEEHYLNLTYKGYGMLEYVNKYCKNLKCVQKTDTDATVNVKGLEKLCNALPENEHIITGMVWHKLGVSRDPNGKHYIPPYVYPNEYYPDFATGTAYLLSGYHIAQRMLDSLRNNTPFFTSGNFRHVNEDALFTGMVRESARIKLQDIGGYMCCIKSHGHKMRFWCENSTGFIKIPIAFENFGQNRQEDLDLLKSWMKNETC